MRCFPQGKDIPIKTTFGCVITMNPDYAGRTELPDNLKVRSHKKSLSLLTLRQLSRWFSRHQVLFRTVAMMIPDYTLIAENMLFAQGLIQIAPSPDSDSNPLLGPGFEQANVLSKKMTQLYKLASEQLSQQKHYDFGMRAVKSVLVMAGTQSLVQSPVSSRVFFV